MSLQRGATDVVSSTVDVTYSPDDGGWYCSRYPNRATTAVYPTREKAVSAAARGEWEDEFAASAVAAPAHGLEAAEGVSPAVDPAPAVGEAPRFDVIEARAVTPGMKIVPKYGKSYEVEAVYVRNGGLLQIRSTDGATKLWCAPDQKVWVQR